jgi:hypothetical protein
LIAQGRRATESKATDPPHAHMRDESKPNPPATERDVYHANQEFVKLKKGGDWRFQKTVHEVGYGKYQRILHLFVKFDEQGNITEVRAIPTPSAVFPDNSSSESL